MGLPESKNGTKTFDDLGLKVSSGEVEVGKTYPIYGMITKLLSDTPGDVIVEINHNITARMSIPDPSKISILKERAFETGIFVSTVTSIVPSVEVDCKTVIFGRPQSYNA